MKFLAVYRPAAPEGTPPSQEHIGKMGELIQEMTNAGVLLATEGCLPSSKGVRVRRSGQKVTVTDGPFAETKELIAGFALFQVQSKEEAIEWTKRFLEVAGDGESEIRQVFEGGNCAPEASTECDEAEFHHQTHLAARI
jgi:hypothetical protein